jgi:hypothetical protein
MTPKKRNKPADDLIDSLMNDLQKTSAEDPTALQPVDSSTEAPPEFQSAAHSETSVHSSHASSDDKTVPFGAPAAPKKSVGPAPKVSFGMARPSTKDGGTHSMSTVDSQLQQVENLKLAQKRILELEVHLEKIRTENEQLASIAEIAKSREEELLLKIQSLEKSKAEIRDHGALEINIFRDNLQSKEFEATRLRMRVEELEGRLQADLKKIRVRERELENRLELSKMEKNALLKSKDDNILELKRKLDQVGGELEVYKQKCVELNQRIEMNNEQFSRTVRALRLALTNLEANENTNSITLTAIKKAE